MMHPDPRKHQLISFVKSGVRIVGCGAGIGASAAGILAPAIFIFATAMLMAEIIGIYEELV